MDHPLKELRKILGMKQWQFAEAIGSTRNYVAQVETGSTMGREFALKVRERYGHEMDVHGISLEELLRGERAPEPEEDENGVVRRARK